MTVQGPYSPLFPLTATINLQQMFLKNFLKKEKKKQTQLPEHSELKKTEK